MYFPTDSDLKEKFKKSGILPGQKIAVLRCRTSDAINFQKNCRWVMTFENDPEAQKVLTDSAVPYKHCVYYYAHL